MNRVVTDMMLLKDSDTVLDSETFDLGQDNYVRLQVTLITGKNANFKARVFSSADKLNWVDEGILATTGGSVNAPKFITAASVSALQGRFVRVRYFQAGPNAVMRVVLSSKNLPS